VLTCCQQQVWPQQQQPLGVLVRQAQRHQGPRCRRWAQACVASVR
jgi:hypothetical protein